MAVRILETKTLHDGWTRLLLARVRLADGSIAGREIEDHGRAVAVLPYDPARGAVMLVRLLRPPMLYAEGLEASLEAPAGIIEDEPAEDSARREALEETGLRLTQMEFVASAWSSPGLSTERVELYLAPYAERDRIAPGGGAAGERENITVAELSAAHAWRLTQTGDLRDLKTLTLLMALRLRRPEMFG